MPGLPGGTVTFLFTDIAGSTRLWQAHHAVMEQAYARHDAILRDAITRHGGVVYKVIGDAFQVAFPTAPAAVSAALEAQQGLQAEDWAIHGLPEPLRVRMALHTGAVDPDPDGDYRSPVLNRVGRLLGAGHGGQVLVSDVVRGLTRDYLPAGASLLDLGIHQLKDLLAPEPIHQLVHADLLADFPPLVTLTRQRHNLPRQPTPFLGREQEVAQLTALLNEDEVQLVTLTGPGGTGKTRLALQAAAEVVEAFADGVWFVDLAPVSDPLLVPSAIAAVLGVRESGATPLPELVREHLRDKQLLLVLDNLEQLLPGAATPIGDLLGAAPGLTVLATSRGPLRLRAEREYPVPPLGLPRRKPPPTLAQLGQYAAVRLFIERAQAARPDFAVTSENAPAVAEICHRLDGLPLAIELAAARIRMLSPEAMLRRLEQRLTMLTGGARDLPVRQQTLRGAIAWSYDLLTPDEQALFRRLSVFVGGATLEAIEAVAAGDELGLAVFDGLERLVDQSLVRQTEAEGEPRFTMLESIRAFGLEQLKATGEDAEAGHRHAAHFLTLAELAKPEMEGPAQGSWLDRLETEHDNLRAALAWGLVHNPEAALRMVGALYPLWCVHGYLAEGRAAVKHALRVANDQVDTGIRAKALNGGGQLAFMQGDMADATAYFSESLDLRRLGNDLVDIASVLHNLANVKRVQGDLSGAERLSEESLALCRQAGDEIGVAMSVMHLADLAYIQDDFARASVLYEESVALARKEGATLGVARGLHNLALVVLAQGQTEPGLRYLEESLALDRELGNKPGLAGTLITMADAAFDAGNERTCVTCLNEGLMLSVELGAAGLIAEALEVLVRLIHDTTTAVQFVAAAAKIRAETGIMHDSVEQSRIQVRIESFRQHLGERSFTKAWKEGQLMPMHDVIAQAQAMLSLMSEN